MVTYQYSVVSVIASINSLRESSGVIFYNNPLCALSKLRVFLLLPQVYIPNKNVIESSTDPNDVTYCEVHTIIIMYSK